MKQAKMYLLAVALSMPILTRESSGATLSGSLVDEQRNPACGCVVTLAKLGTTDTVAHSTFALTNLPAARPAWAQKKTIVQIDLFTLEGRKCGRVEALDVPQGRFRSVFPFALAHAMYVMKIKVGSLSSTVKFLSVADERLPTIIGPRTMARLSLAKAAAEDSTIDTLKISCPQGLAKSLSVASYSGDLGVIPLAKVAATAAAFSEVVFAVRSEHGGHWYENFGYYSFDSTQKAYGYQGRLCKVNLTTQAVTVLVNDTLGCVRDPQVSYDGTKILFSYRKGGTQNFNLYEIKTDGTGLKQLTSGPWDDIEPTYLPDSSIMFCSSRAKRWVNCFVVQVANLHRCDADGSNIREISANIEQDNTPWPLPDGRVVYTRWEYVDRSQMRYHHLWYMRPDGTGQMVYYGNYIPDNVRIDAKPVPGTSNVVCMHSYGHGTTEHTGDVAIINVQNGPDNPNGEKIISSGGTFRDPFPLSPDSFLVANGTSLALMRGNGQATTLYQLSAALSANGAKLNEPRPICARPREPILSNTTDLTDSMGTLLLLDVYIGRNMTGVNQGDIKKLLVLETLPKPVNFAGQMEPMTFGGTFTMDRVIGTVPVEADGSAYIRLPANRSFFFVALDSNDNSVKRMQSFLSVVPGEKVSCIGCHEDRTMTTPNLPARIAAGKPPVTPQPIANMPKIFDYPRDIQPLWDKYCLSCHDMKTHQGGVDMTGDNGPLFTHSYFELASRLQIADGRDESRSEYPPRQIGSTASPLLKKVNGSHYGVVLTADELRKVKLWIDASAHFPGTYAALGWGSIGIYTENALERPDQNWPVMQIADAAMARRCNGCHTGNMKLPTSPSDDMGMSYDIAAYDSGTAVYDAQYLPPWLSSSPSTSTVPMSCWLVVDGIIGQWNTGEWASNGELNPWVNLAWSSPHTVNKIVLYDRVNTTDWAPGGLLTFSDGSTVTVTGIDNAGAAKTVTFTNKTITWVNFQVQGGSGQNVGLSEFQVFDTSGVNVAPLVSNVTCSSIENYGSGAPPPVAYTDPATVGSTAWMKQYADPRLQFHRERVYDLTNPAKSLLLLAPLSVSGGGFATCGNVFASTSDTDYVAILNSAVAGKNYIDSVSRFNMPNFHPRQDWVREMIRYGILPAGTKSSSSIDVYATEEKYWESLWWKPVPVTVGVKQKTRQL